MSSVGCIIDLTKDDVIVDLTKKINHPVFIDLTKKLNPPVVIDLTKEEEEDDDLMDFSDLDYFSEDLMIFSDSEEENVPEEGKKEKRPYKERENEVARLLKWSLKK